LLDPGGLALLRARVVEDLSVPDYADGLRGSTCVFLALVRGLEELVFEEAVARLRRRLKQVLGHARRVRGLVQGQVVAGGHGVRRDRLQGLWLGLWRRRLVANNSVLVCMLLLAIAVLRHNQVLELLPRHHVQIMRFLQSL
jgi:hypothetical protein